MSAPLLTLAGVRLSRPGREVLRGVELSLAAGEIRALMGLSGAGKSTVLRAVAALEPFQAGTIDVGGVRLHPGPVPRQGSLGELRSRVGMVFQAHALFEHLTALQNVMLAPVHALGWTEARAAAVAMELLESLGVAARAGARPRELSGGEAQRVAIARALAPGPGLLLMDEPTSALDPARRGGLGEALRRLAGEGRAILVATHDIDFARAFTDRVAVLSDGAVVEEGPSPHVLAGPRHPATRSLLASPGSPLP